MKARRAVAALLLLLTCSTLACSTLACSGAEKVDFVTGEQVVAGEQPDARAPTQAHYGMEAVAPSVALPSPWGSPGACERAVAAHKLSPRTKGTARIVSWNVRWFPDGVMPGPSAVKKPTNIDWLACSVAWLDADLFALEEVLNHPDAKLAMNELVARLNVLTGGEWRADVDPCPQPRAQHQGFLYDTKKTTITMPHRFDWRPGDWCDLSMRPAWTGYVKTKSGLDFHLAAVHAKSGVDARSYGLRQESLGRLSDLVADTQKDVADMDVVVTGDFNTMGSTDKTSPVAPDEELATLDAVIAGKGFSRVPATQSCSEYSGSRRHLLDHFLTSDTMEEVPSAATTVVTGYCAELACGAIPSPAPRVQTEVSDHCPVVLDLEGRDLD